MKPIALKDLIPKASTFKLAATGKEYRLRPVNLADERWMAETFGDEINSIFSQMRMLQVCRILFHQLEEEDKSDFAQREVKVMNEEGLQTVRKMGGAELLFWQVQGLEEKVEIFKSLMETIGVSRQMVDRFEKEAAEELAQDKKKASRSTGQESSTGSAPSMAGPPSTSGRSRSAKSPGVLKGSGKGKSTALSGKRA